MTTLTEPYYSEAHQVFRAATNQAELMLDRTVGHIVGRGTVTILSVGSGAGLFEIPMLARLRDAGVTVSSFVGVDPSPRACSVLRSARGSLLNEPRASQRHLKMAETTPFRGFQ